MIVKLLVSVLLLYSCRNTSFLFDGNNNTSPDRYPVDLALPVTKIVEQVWVSSPKCKPYPFQVVALPPKSSIPTIDYSDLAALQAALYAARQELYSVQATDTVGELKANQNYNVKSEPIPTPSAKVNPTRRLTSIRIPNSGQPTIVATETANQPVSSIQKATTVSDPLPASSDLLANDRNSYIPTIPAGSAPTNLGTKSESSMNSFGNSNNPVRPNTPPRLGMLNLNAGSLPNPTPLQLSYQQYLQSYGTQKTGSQFFTRNSAYNTYRELIFNERIKAINLHNRNRTRTYNMGLNDFTDLDLSEIRQLFSGFQPASIKEIRASVAIKKPNSYSDKRSAQINIKADQIAYPLNRIDQNQAANAYTQPDAWNIDWRCVSQFPVFSIGDCGACSFFSTVDALFISLRIWGYNPNPFSAQATISCLNQSPLNVCKYGANFLYVYEFIRKYGVGSASAYPYSDQNRKVDASECRTDKLRTSAYRKKLLFTRQTYIIEENDCKEVVEQLKTRALTVAIIANPNFINYQTGTFDYDTSLGEETNHAVVLVGYNPKDGYLIKNVWGTKWGQKGYAYVSRQSGVCSWAVYAKQIYQQGN